MFRRGKCRQAAVETRSQSPSCGPLQRRPRHFTELALPPCYLIVARSAARNSCGRFENSVATVRLRGATPGHIALWCTVEAKARCPVPLCHYSPRTHVQQLLTRMYSACTRKTGDTARGLCPSCSRGRAQGAPWRLFCPAVPDRVLHSSSV